MKKNIFNKKNDYRLCGYCRSTTVDVNTIYCVACVEIMKGNEPKNY